MKKYIISGLLLGIGAMFTTTTVFAHDGHTHDDVTLPNLSSISTVNSVVEKNERLTVSSLARIKSKGSSLINDRIKTIQINSSAINESKALTLEQKASLTAVLNKNATDLTALNTSIQAGTDASTTKVLVESIYTNFRIYGIVIPQIRLEKRIYDLQNHASLLSDSFVKVQLKINEYKAQGKDVTTWQKSLDDAKLLVATDLPKIGSLMVQAQALKPSDYGTTSKATITSINLGIKSIAKDFNKIKGSVRKPEKLISINASSTLR